MSRNMSSSRPRATPKWSIAARMLTRQVPSTDSWVIWRSAVSHSADSFGSSAALPSSAGNSISKSVSLPRNTRGTPPVA